jgi:hypothetical protein
MSWLQPLECTFHIRRGRRRDGTLMPEPKPRPVTINGVAYRSMKEARHALGWTYRQVYTAIGEGWRCAKKEAA